ncbi:MAG: hypothetical protein HQM02_07815 [Magnetococcales bacterium]|nr:hypothetical protein [Magnetococcales bacterium]
MDDITPHTPVPEERLQRWLAIGKETPPERLAAYLESPAARWAVITENGPEEDRQRLTAYLLDPRDLPYWAFALAKSYLDDVGEWPLCGMFVEQALSNLEDHGDPIRGVREILAQVKPVWSDLEVLFVGEEAG